MKNGSFMIMFNAKGNGLTRMNLHSQPQSLIIMEQMLWFVYGRITAVLFILSF